MSQSFMLELFDHLGPPAQFLAFVRCPDWGNSCTLVVGGEPFLLVSDKCAHCRPSFSRLQQICFCAAYIALFQKYYRGLTQIIWPWFPD